MSPQSTQTADNHAWDWPDCPECESNVFVRSNCHDLYREDGEDYKCELCDVAFND